MKEEQGAVTRSVEGAEDNKNGKRGTQVAGLQLGACPRGRCQQRQQALGLRTPRWIPSGPGGGLTRLGGEADSIFHP